eukprot:921664-Amphidinium_carterae.1
MAPVLGIELMVNARHFLGNMTYPKVCKEQALRQYPDLREVLIEDLCIVTIQSPTIRDVV